MATEFKLSYTANDINTRLGKIDSLAEKSELPTKTSDLTNDSGFVTETYVQEQVESIIISAPDFAQNDSSAPDYIKNRTHWAEDPVTYTETTLEETTYDGFADGLCNVAGTFNFVDGAECTVTWDGVEYIVVAEQYDLDGMNIVALGNPAILQIEENAEDNGQPFGIVCAPEIQILSLTSNDLEATSHTVKIVSTITTQEIHKLDNKFINSEWMATKELQTIEAVPETTITFLEEGLVTGIGYIQSISWDMPLTKHPKKFITVFDGITYESICFPLSEGEFFFGDMSIFGLTIGTDHPYTATYCLNGIDIFSKTAGDHTIKIDIEHDVYNQLPEGYISNVVDTITSDISNIETQLDKKQDTITGAASTITSSALTADKVLVSDSTGKVGVSEVTSTELGYLSGVTSSVQTQLSTHSDNIGRNNLSASLAKYGSLKWDGVIGDREHIIVSQEGEFNMCLVHVSDECPTYIAPMFEVTVSTALEGEDATKGEFQVQEDGFVFADAFAISPSDNYTSEGITFPKKGIYFMAFHAAPIGYDYSLMHVSALSILGHSFAESSGSDYFETKTETNVVELGDTLTWDGDTEGLVCTDESDLGAGTLAYYKISDSVLTLDDFANGYTLSTNDDGTISTETCTVDNITSVDGQIMAQDFSFVIIPHDNYNDTSVEAGVYFLLTTADNGQIVHTCSLTVPEYNFTAIKVEKKEIIKYEHLPEALQFGEISTTTYGDTLTWDGNTEGLENIGGMLYKISDAAPTLNDVRQGFTYTIRALDNSESATYTVSAEDAASIEMSSDGTISLSYAVIAPLPIVGDEATISAGIYAGISNAIYISSLTINNYSGFPTTTTELVTIDPKYLPEDIGGGSGSGLPEVTTDDNGKTVKVVDGAWSIEQMSYNDLSDKPTLGTLASKNTVSKTDLTSDVQISLGKADTALQSYTEADPTVPAWAKASTKPTYTKSEVGLGNVDNVKQYSASNPPPYPVTKVNNKTGNVTLSATDVGADASGTASSAVSSHNTSTSAHNDIRDLISGLTTRLNALADSDDTTLDQMSEIVAYIKSNKTLIEEVTTNKINVSDIINNLTTNVSTKPLSAAQGVTIKTLIDTLQIEVNGKADAEHTHTIAHIDELQDILDSKVSEDGLFETITSDTITWDGNVDGRDNANGGAMTKVCDISDAMISTIIEMINAGTLNFSITLSSGVIYSTDISDDSVRATVDADVDINLAGLQINNANDGNDVGIVYIVSTSAFNVIGLPSSGLYFSNFSVIKEGSPYVSSLTLNGLDIVNKKVINSDLLQIDLSSINTTTDTKMSDTSENPVQNKVIKAYVDAAIGTAIAASY